MSHSSTTTLDSAFASLLAETGSRPTVRALAAAAGVRFATASAYLREHPDAPKDIAMPDDFDVRALIGPLWAAAVAAARQEVAGERESLEQQFYAAVSSETEALEAAETAAQELEVKDREVGRLRGLVTVAEQRADEAVERVEAARRAENEARVRVATAEATTATLREVVAALTAREQSSDPQGGPESVPGFAAAVAESLDHPERAQPAPRRSR